jgi:hypothetical protein
MVSKVDSNVTGLRYAEEASIKTLPGSPVWYPLEPNSYNDFGGQISTVARNPINPSRQRKKGTVTGLEASGGFNTDLTQNNIHRLMQGYFFADAREKVSTMPLNTAAVVMTAATATTYTAAAGLGIFAANNLILGRNFGVAANNGLKVVTSATATTVTVTGNAIEASPPATSYIRKVGHQYAATDVSITSGANPTMTCVAGDFTTLGVIPGEWIYVGGDTAITAFATAANNGFARVRTVAAKTMTFDKTNATWVTDAGTGKTIQLFIGTVIKNESASASIIRRTYQLERTLGSDGVGTMTEYLTGAVPSEMEITVAQEDKVTIDLSFVATDNEQRTGTTGVKSGTRPDLVDADCFNTSSDFSRIRMAIVDPTTSNPTPLFAYLTEASLSLANNVSPNKAVGILGAFDVSAGTFEVSGNVTAYFADVTAVQAVRNNEDVTIDFALVKNNSGILFDIPLLSLGEGRLSVEQDQPITLPLSMAAAQSVFNHTLLYMNFDYLPTVAEA